jgi:hypothetical protein
MNTPVFPQDQISGEGKFRREGGMELRDYIAVHCLPLLMSATKGNDPDDMVQRAVRGAYRIADVMVKERGSNAKA